MNLIHSETSNPTASGQWLPTLLSYVRDLEVDALRLSSPESHGAYPEIFRFFTNWYFQGFKRCDISHFFGRFGRTVTTLKLFESFFNSGVLISLTSLFFRSAISRSAHRPTPIGKPTGLKLSMKTHTWNSERTLSSRTWRHKTTASSSLSTTGVRMCARSPFTGARA